MSTNSEIYSLFPMRLELPGPSAGSSFPITIFQPLQGQQSVAIKIMGGGTCRMVPAQGATLTPGGATQILNGVTLTLGTAFGFLLETDKPLSLNMRGPMYFMTSGATCVLEMVIGRTKGDWI